MHFLQSQKLKDRHEFRALTFMDEIIEFNLDLTLTGLLFKNPKLEKTIIL